MSELVLTIQSLCSPSGLILMAVGTSLGIVVGAMPGLTGAMLIALSLPLTFSMTAEHALILLVSMYVGSVSGGLITATLMRIPGTPASMMTTYDGYPMAQSGQARRALGLGIFASLFGGLVGWVFLVLLSAPLARFSLTFGPFEFFALVLMALVLMAAVSGRSLTKGLFAGLLGILFAMPGASPASGQPRWTFGLHELDAGFRLLPVLIGLFAINQVLLQILNDSKDSQQVDCDAGSMWLRWTEIPGQLVNLMRSSTIGVIIGILPGIGANIGSVVAYAAAKGFSKTPQRFGQGSEEGIVASESANNATVGGALIPLIAMGIPGSVIDAVLLGALTIHGLQPGPLLMEQNPQTVNVIMGTMLVANLYMFGFMLLATSWLARLSRISTWMLVPVILTLCVLGSYALANRFFDVWVMLAFGGVGFLLERFRIPLAPLVIGFVLAPVAEEHLTEGLMQSGGSWLPLFTRPVALLFLVAAAGAFVFSLLRFRSPANHGGT